MKTDEINTLSTAVVAYVAVLGLIWGLYYNMKSLNIGIIYIFLFQGIVLFIIGGFIIVINKKIKDV